MQNISNLIARSSQAERKVSGAWAAGVFVVVLILGSAGAAVWIGNSVSAPSEAAPIAFADEGFQ